MLLNRVYPLFLVVITTQSDMRHTQANNLRIYNGMDDVTLKYPYVVCLKSGDYRESFLIRLCTGSLISANWVITASHCLVDRVQYIQYGNMSIPLFNTKSKSRVQKMIQHPHYMEATTINDIGLMLVSPVLMSKYGSLSALDYMTLNGHSVEYAGYGMTFLEDANDTESVINEIIYDMFRPLQIGEAIVNSCDDEYLGRNLICLASKCNFKQTVLPGDSGGPLIYDGKVVAIACAILSDYSAQAFTPVSPHLTWIHRVISSESYRKY